jgi:hypothetical protein
MMGTANNRGTERVRMCEREFISGNCQLKNRYIKFSNTETAKVKKK